ncbi:MAG: energy transducer TonB [Alistipes sp.]|nr:energy transducer TonB [Alistipes sp.]
MEIKKSPKADLQNKKSLFMEIGLVIALAVMALAFWYHKSDNKIKTTQVVQEVLEVEEIDVTRQDDTPPPPPQQAQIQVITNVLKIVSNDQKIDNTISFIDEGDAFDELEIVYQEKEEEIEEEEIFVNAEVMPKFQGGGLEKFRAWVQNNVRYPQIAQENGIQGNVIIKFVVEPDGKLSRFEVLQTPDKSLSDAAIAVLQKSPKWEPGRQRNKPVRCTYTLPVIFRIQN